MTQRRKTSGISDTSPLRALKAAAQVDSSGEGGISWWHQCQAGAGLAPPVLPLVSVSCAGCDGCGCSSGMALVAPRGLDRRGHVKDTWRGQLSQTCYLLKKKQTKNQRKIERKENPAFRTDGCQFNLVLLASLLHP